MTVSGGPCCLYGVSFKNRPDYMNLVSYYGTSLHMRKSLHGLRYVL